MAALQGRRILLHLRPLPLLAQQGFRRAIAPPIPHCRFLSPSFPPAAAASPSLPTSATAVVQAARGAGSVVLEQRGGTSVWPPSSSSSSALLLHAAAPWSWACWTTTPADHMVLMLLGANASVFMLWRVLAYPSFIADPYMVWLDMYFRGRLHTLLMSTSSLVDPAFMAKHFMVSLPGLVRWRFHTLLTYAFSHVDPKHLFNNMFGLCFFGSSVANEFGPAFILELYVAGALIGALFYLAEMSFLAPRKMGPGGWLTPCLGASAAVNATVLLEIFLYPKRLIYLNFFVPVPAALVGVGLIGVDLWRVKKGQSRVSGSSHLGGALVAVVAFAEIKGWI